MCYRDGTPVVGVKVSDRVLAKLLNYAESSDCTGGNDDVLQRTIECGDFAHWKAKNNAARRTAKLAKLVKVTA